MDDGQDTEITHLKEQAGLLAKTPPPPCAVLNSELYVS